MLGKRNSRNESASLNGTVAGAATGRVDIGAVPSRALQSGVKVQCRLTATICVSSRAACGRLRRSPPAVPYRRPSVACHRPRACRQDVPDRFRRCPVSDRDEYLATLRVAACFLRPTLALPSIRVIVNNFAIPARVSVRQGSAMPSRAAKRDRWPSLMAPRQKSAARSFLASATM
jgi:hypothetical protein